VLSLIDLYIEVAFGCDIENILCFIKPYPGYLPYHAVKANLLGKKSTKFSFLRFGVAS
jgi:DNA repair photolyase